MPLPKSGIWYWIYNRFLSLAWREVKYRYTDVELNVIDDNIDGMRIQNLMALVRNQGEERHVSENVAIG